MAEELSQQPPQPPQGPKEEKLEFLKREEVRTMAKDIAKVREQESRSERERIAGLPQGKEPKIILSEQAPQEQQKPKEEVKRSLMPKSLPSGSEKLFVRLIVGGVIVFVLFNVVAFSVWMLQRDGKAESPAPIESSDSTAPSNDGVEPTPPPALPTPVLFFEAPETITIQAQEDLLLKLEGVLSQELPEGLTHIVLEKSGGGVLSLEEFLSGTNITMPGALKDALSPDIMVFAHGANTKKRLGFVAKFKETQDAQALLLAWEKTLEPDTSSFFDIIGKKGAAYTSVFRSSLYKGFPVRFQTFSVVDFGIVYGLTGDLLVFSSSSESWQEVIDQIQSSL